MAKKITLLGSTGSIGTQSLDVIRAQGYEVFGLSAHSQTDKILQQIEEFHPKYVCMTSEAGAEKLSAALALSLIHISLFGGGGYDSDARKGEAIMDAYNASLTRTTAASLSVADVYKRQVRTPSSTAAPSRAVCGARKSRWTCWPLLSPRSCISCWVPTP